MSNGAVMFIKPKAITQNDKSHLRKAGIIVVEVEDPQSVKFIRAETELPSGDLIDIMAKVIRNGGEYTQSPFGKLLAEALLSREPKK